MGMRHEHTRQRSPTQRLAERIDVLNVPCSSINKRRRAATEQVGRVAGTGVRTRVETWDRSDRHESGGPDGLRLVGWESRQRQQDTQISDQRLTGS